MKERILGIDYGEKRIGIAVSDALGLTAQSKPYIRNDEFVMQKLIETIEKYDIKLILCGLPKHTQGGVTEKEKEVKQFIESVKAQYSISVEFWDERFSTKAVTRHLISGGVSRKKRKEIIDSQAAAFILQGYLDKL